MSREHGFQNFTEIITDHAGRTPDDPAFTFIGNSGEVIAHHSFGGLHQQAMTVAGLLRAHAGPGDRAMLLYAPGMAFIEAFMGCLYAGVVAVPAAPPATPDMFDRLEHIIHDASPRVVLSDKTIAPFFPSMKQRFHRLADTSLFNTEEIDPEWRAGYAPTTLDRQSLALLQYTSGSTGYPKGVMVTHGNLLHNEAMLTRYTGQTRNSVAVSWLPHYHDMGLIGCILFPCHVGFHSVLMAPERFVRDPLCWLKAISDYRATFSTAPNFAYALCVRHGQKAGDAGLDLSRWAVAINGAEPVRLEALERFYQVFKPYGLKKKVLRPAYGLAEATLFVAGSGRGKGPTGLYVERQALGRNRIIRRRRSFADGVTIVNHGATADDQRIVVVDGNGALCADGTIGEIWLSGPSVAAGYWHQPEETQVTFNAHLANGDGPFLRTGDLGFLDRGSLYITGRLKDLIIIQGRNIYPQDIEAAVESIDAEIRAGRVAAFAVPGDLGEALGIVAEYRGVKERAAELFGRVNLGLSQAFGVKPETIVLIRPRTLQVTSSGKIRRKDTRNALFDGRLETIAVYQRAAWQRPGLSGIAPLPGSGLAARLREMIAAKLGLTGEAIEVDAPLGRYGLSSMDAVAIAAELEAWGLGPVPPALIYANPTISGLAGALAEDRPAQDIPARVGGRTAAADPIAIIGMACCFPGAPDLDRFWQILEKGQSCISALPAGRPGLRTRDARAADKACRWGGFIDGMAHFDAAFFNISAMEAEWMDPQHRKFLEIAWSAMENAGYAPSRLAGSRTGVFVGLSAQEYHRMAFMDPSAGRTYAATGLSAALIANRLSYLMNFRGPSETIDTACSSSLVAVHRAVRALRGGECDLAIAGGANALLSVETFAVLAKAGFLSDDGVCRPFDAAANGYVRAEGFGAVLLKPLGRARRDRDHIYALIRGSAVNHGGRTASLTAPSENRQAMLLKAAYTDAGLSPRTVTYIETHGTGTRLGDPIEVNGLKKAFGAAPEDLPGKAPEARCALGSVKSNIGHAEAAAGMAGLIKTALALEKAKIPATVHFRKLNPYIAIKGTPFYIVRKSRPWRCAAGADGKPLARRAGVSSFGFGGTYAHVVLEAAEAGAPAPKSGPANHLVLLSGKTPRALLRNIQALSAWLAETAPPARRDRPRLADIAFTTQWGRDHYQCRAAFIAGSKAELGRLLSLARDRVRGAAGELFAAEKAKRHRRWGTLQQAAAAWLKGAAFDGNAIVARRPGQRVALPAYQFEPTPHWIDRRQWIETPATQGAPADAPGDSPSLGEALRWLTHEAATMLGVSTAGIVPETTFDELGLDSLALIHLHDRMQRRFSKSLPLSVIQEYPNIQTLAKRLAGDTADITPDLWQEVAARKARLPRLRESPAGPGTAPKQTGLGDHILLTGATGFLGIFLLSELLARTTATIHCLVRAADADSGRRRLGRMMERFAIPGTVTRPRVRVVCGDLARQRFGLPPGQYDALAGTVDTVFHCGAVVDWMKSYSALKKANVDGTLEALRFSGHGNVKGMHHISSLAVLPLIQGKFQWLETDQPPPEALTNGYAQSKWVAERLCAEARAAGLPVSIYRFDYVAASVRTGAMKETDFIVRLIRGCIEIGCIPSDEVNFDIHAVDHLSRAIVAIARSARPGTFHLINRKPFLMSDFTRVIRNFGYPLEPVPFHHWKQLVRADTACALFALHPFLDQYDADQLAHYRHSTIDNTHALTALYAADQELILGAPPAAEVMKKVIACFRASHVLPIPKHEAVLKRQAEYWRRQLVDAPARLALPAQAPGGAENPSPSVETFTIDAAVVARMAALARAEKAVLPEILLSVFQVLLFRYGRGTDIPVAVPVAVPGNGAGRWLARVPVVRIRLTPPASLRTLLPQVKQIALEAYAHLDLPSDIIAAILRGRDGHQAGGYDVLFAFSDAAGGRLNLFPLALQDVWSHDARLTLWLETSDDAMRGRVHYAPHLFSITTVTRFIQHFQNLLKILVGDPDADLFRWSFLEPVERQRMIHQWNATARSFSGASSIHTIFARQARARPDAMALFMDGRQMTYGELDRKSDRLARYLVSRGVGPDDVVGLCMEKSFELMVGILGILKAGGAYCALEPSYPEQRLNDMLADARAKLVLTHSATARRLAGAGVSVIRLDREWEGIDRAGQESEAAGRNKAGRAGDVAYIIYTSGSTGRPKGVRVLHAGLVNLLYAMDEHLRIEAGEWVLSCSSLSYDASVPELFLPLFKGATLALIPMAVARDGFRLKAFLDAHPIAFMNAAVPTWRMLEYAGWQGSPSIRLINGGEALPLALARTLIRWGRAAFNGYGPAEATVCATIKRLMPGQPVTIGTPLANIQAYILDDFLNPMPVGAIGELYIGGAGVARGYHHRPELTGRCFLPDPFADDPSRRIYRTGDLAYFLPSGEIVFVGRSDQQVKIRGHRIELGEIERCLERLDQIKACTALVMEDRAGAKRIVAYLIAADGTGTVDIARVRQEIGRVLPAFMVPGDFIVMERFPVTPGGKIDRRAFPGPAPTEPPEAFAAPRSALDIQIADLWKEILNLREVGIHSNFLDLGGDSVSAMRLLLAINARFGIELTIQNLYDHLTIARLSKAILSFQASGGIAESAAAIDFDAEAAFDPPAPPHAGKPAGAVPDGLHHLMITGATGFLGAYMLHALLERTDSRLFCLVRAANPADATLRIRTHLERCRLWKAIYAGRITPVPGDLGQPLLGIDETLYEDLSRHLDAIYHCGSVVNFAYPYQLLKKPNVDGTRQLLKMAAHGKIKHLFYISTIGVYEQYGAIRGQTIEEHQALPDPHGLFFGYSQSKWVAERMVAAARQGDLPVSIFRPSAVLGATTTGVSNLDDLVNLMIKVFVRVGAVPDLNFRMNGLPVDFVADTVVRISLSPLARGANFHIINPQSIPVGDLIGHLIAYGFDLPILPCDRWLELLCARVRGQVDLAPYVPVIEKEISGMNGNPLPTFSFANTRKIIADYASRVPAINEKLFRVYLGYLESVDFIRRP